MGRMRIGFDARAAFLDPKRGFGRFARQTGEALLRLVPGQVVVFVPHGARVPAPWYPLAARIVQLRRPRRAAFLIDPVAWRVALARNPVDVLHLPAWTVPRGLPVPVVATFHDATPFRFASPPEWWRRRRARAMIRSLVNATLVQADSHYAKNELAATVGLTGVPVHVVHLGVGAPFVPVEPTPTPHHLLYVGGTDPHKNLSLLMSMLALPGAESLPPLVVATSGPGAAAAAQQAQRLGVASRVVPVADVDDDALATLYRNALILLLPSQNEGFGLPALEAMACGCPVLAANRGALPEVTGGAAHLLEPSDPAVWLAEVQKLASEPQQRLRMGAAGVARARGFSWDRTARRLLVLYRTATRLASTRS
jgi:glycosyltransferase involved in cell wall biosynthesis